MTGLARWNLERGTRAWYQMTRALPAEAYLKLFRRDFWEGSFRAIGHEAMKLNTGQPFPGTINLTEFDWDMVREKFGTHAGEWLQKAHGRLTDEIDNTILWEWLYYRTVLAVEHLEVDLIWQRATRKWGPNDAAVWKYARGMQSRTDRLRAKIIENATFGGVDDAVAREITRGLLGQPDQNPDPLEALADFRQYYSFLRIFVRNLSREAASNQNMAAAYARLEDEGTKQRIRQVYARKFRARMGLIYVLAVNNTIKMLDSWDSLNDMIISLLNATNGVRQILGEGRDELRAKLNALEVGFRAVMAVFSEADEEEYQLGVEMLRIIPKSAVKTTARRIERMAKLEYNRLAPGSTLKNIANDWMFILQSGDTLIDPPPGSDGDVFNQALDNRNRSIDMTATAQMQAAEAAHPDPQGSVHEQVSNLANQQPQYGECRFSQKKKKKTKLTKKSGTRLQQPAPAAECRGNRSPSLY